jgi:hypothetical protein
MSLPSGYSDFSLARSSFISSELWETQRKTSGMAEQSAGFTAGGKRSVTKTFVNLDSFKSKEFEKIM